MANSLRPHGLQPTRLLCPCVFLDKNTRVDCHFLLQGIFSTQRPNLCLLLGRWLLYHGAILEALPYIQFSSVQSLSYVRLFVTPWIAARQASLSITNSQSLLKLMFIELVIPSSHLILCHLLLLLPPIPLSIRVFSNVNSSHEVARVLEFQLHHQSFQWTPRTDLL